MSRPTCSRVGTCLPAIKTFADDIGVLATEEQCDVIVDDIGYYAS